MNRTFQAFKKALDGSGECWDHVVDLTHDEARDEQRFPLGRLTEANGRKYQWTYSIMPRYVPSAEASLKALGRPSAPLPSAAGVILSHLSGKR